MRILCLTPFIPWPLNRGTHQRVYHLLKSLSQRHQLTLFSLDPDNQGAEHQDVFEAFCQRVERVPVALNPWRSLSRRLLSPQPETMHHWDLPDVRERLARLLQSERFDAIYCEDICMTQYLFEINPDLPVITDRNRVDLEYMSEKAPYIKGLRQRLAFHENSLKLARFEQRVIERFRHQVVCSPEDRDFLDQRFGICPTVVGNGFDPDYFCPQPWQRTDAQPVLCFTGAMDYAPNADAMAWFVESIYPLLREQLGDFRLRIVGINPDETVRSYGRLPGIEVTGAVADIRPAYAACDLYIAPLRIGGGTRLKILEALGMGKAVVSTPTGAQGLGLEHGRTVRFADSASGFAQEIVTLLAQPEQLAAQALAGRAHALAHFSWAQAGERLLELVDHLTEPSAA